MVVVSELAVIAGPALTVVVVIALTVDALAAVVIAPADVLGPALIVVVVPALAAVVIAPADVL